jgi:hypothetical protein
MPMTDYFSLRFVILACAILFCAATATSAHAQIRIDRDQTGRVVAITGLPTATGCVRGTGMGRVVDRVVEKGELQGFTFNEPPYDDSYINLPAAYDIRDRAAYTRLQAAFDDLFRKGARLKVRSVACGAAGRIVKLVSATLVDDPPAPKAAPVAAPAPAPVPAPMPTTNDQPAAAPSGGTGIKMDDGDNSLLQSPGSTPKPATTAQQQPAQPTAPPPQRNQPQPAADEEGAWDFSTYARKAKLGIADGNHFTTLVFDCVRGSGRTTILADDPQGKYRRGSRQTFKISADQESVSITGSALYSDMNSEMQIEATIGIDQIQGVLSEIARQNRFIIRTPGGSQSVDIRGAAIAIPKYLAACGRSR